MCHLNFVSKALFLVLLLPQILFPSSIALGADSDPVLNYMEVRKELISQDAKLSFSSKVQLSENEQKLENYLQTFCYHFWNHFLESNLFPPSRNFSEAKSSIESTLLFRILKRMPKGGILHIHADSTGSATWLVKRAAEDENCYIYLQDDDAVLKGTMRIFKANEVPQGYQSMRKLANTDGSFISKVVDMITLGSIDTNSVNPWKKFNECFARIEHLLYYEPIFRDYYKHALESIAEDQVLFVELRTSLDSLYDLSGKTYSTQEVIGIYRDILKHVRKTYPGFNLKIIFSDLRSKNIEEARVNLEKAFKLRADNPDIIVGYDLVGFETSGHTLLYYLDNLLTAASQFEKKYKVSLPYFFHAGESGWGHDKNTYDAVLLNSKRIGHGFNLVHSPQLIQQIKKQNMCIEICPISNQMLGYSRDLRMHPAVGYLKQGVACTLGSDDPLLLKTTGLTYDFWEAIMAWNLSLSDVKQLCLNSILYSSLTEEEKKQTLDSWQRSWDRFVKQTLADLQVVN